MAPEPQPSDHIDLNGQCGPKYDQDLVYRELLADPTAFEEYDADEAGARYTGVVRLTELAIEHLVGAR